MAFSVFSGSRAFQDSAIYSARNAAMLVIGNTAISNWSIAYEKEYLEEIIGRFVGIGAKDDIGRTRTLFKNAQEFVDSYIASLGKRHYGFMGNEPIEEEEITEVIEHATKLIEPLTKHFS